MVFAPAKILATPVEEIIPASLNISQDTVWSGRKILNGSQVRVESGATLTLLPGTTITGNNGAMLYILGYLKAVGDEEKKIRFTSNPQLQNNFSLGFFIESGVKSEIELKNFILERGGGNQGTASLPALTIRGKGRLDRGIIKRNKITAIRNWGGDLKIERSELYENDHLALENKAAMEVGAEENWWGEDGGPNQSGKNTVEKTAGSVDFKPWENKGPRPIIFLPGIGGSMSFQMLNKNFHDYWFLNPMGTASYRSFVKNLILTGYEHEKNFFWGFYDWRMSNSKSAESYLKKLIKEVKMKNEHFEVNLVAHSMGGLMARSYIQSDFFGDDVDRFVTLGTPHLGSSDIYSIWEGEEFPEDNEMIEIYLWFLKALDPEKDYSSIVRKEFPSIGEMLPIYDNLKNAQSNQVINYFSQNQTNQFLEHLRENKFLAIERTTLDLMAGVGEPTLEFSVVDLDKKSEKNWRDGKPNPLPPIKDTVKGDDRVIEKSALAENELGGTSTLSSSHSDLPEKAMEKVFSQMKIQPKNPWVTSSMKYLIFGLSGLVDIIIEDSLGRLISLKNQSIPESFLIESGENNKKKLAYAEMLLADNFDKEKITLKLKGYQEEKTRIALWTLGEGKRNKIELEKEIGPGVSLDIQLQLKAKSLGEVEAEIIAEKYSGTIKFKNLDKGEKILNWKTIQPEIEFWQSKFCSDNETSELRLDGKRIEGALDLSKLEVGKRELKVVRLSDQNVFDEASLEFEIVSSIKSLITVIAKDFSRGDIKEETNRDGWLNDLAISYQLLSNGENKLALEKLKDLFLKVEADQFEEEKEREKIKGAIMAIIENPI